MQCGVCGATDFTRSKVLWAELIEEWELSPHEAEYIDRQQSECCSRCGANLRSIALANAIRAHLGTPAPLSKVTDLPLGRDLRVLEINTAGSLTATLSCFGGYVFGAYPEVDMMCLPYESAVFDIVVHSDTLEHVPHPVQALSECRRVLRVGGAVCFTVPTVVGRLSRSREGLPKSYHGAPGEEQADYVVRTEFGADVWTYVLEAGFRDVLICSVEYPVALALLARNA